MLDGKRIAILAEEDFEDSELVEPMRAMKNAGARVDIIGGGNKETHTGKRGNATIRIDTTADKVKAEDFDAIIVPGGYAPDKMRLHQSMIDLVKQAYDSGKRVVELVRKDVKPRDILTKNAFENAIRVDMAMGGSTNTVLHIPAIGKEAHIDIQVDLFDKISQETPNLCSIIPAGNHEMADIDKAGGIPAVLKRLIDMIKDSPCTLL